MTKPIIQRIQFNGVSAALLYSQYLDSKVHSQITDSKALISPREGKNFSAYDGYITGRNIHLFPGRMIVQIWKSSDWQDTQESVLTLEFEDSGLTVFFR